MLDVKSSMQHIHIKVNHTMCEMVRKVSPKDAFLLCCKSNFQLVTLDSVSFVGQLSIVQVSIAE